VADVIFEGERLLYVVEVPALGRSLQVYHHDPEALAVFASGTAVVLGWSARDLIVFENRTSP